MNNFKNSFRPLNFGLLPVDHIKATLEIDLEVGEVVMSANAQKHASRRHFSDYNLCLPFIAGVLADPLYLGDDFNNSGKIEVIGRPHRLGQPLLIAVEITKDDKGQYNLVSFYPVSDVKIQNRRQKGFLKVAKK